MPRRTWAGNHTPLDGVFTINRNSPQARGLQVWVPGTRGENPLGVNGTVTAKNTSITVIPDATLGRSVYNLPAGYIEFSNIAGGGPMRGSAAWSMATWFNLNSTSTDSSILCLSNFANGGSAATIKVLSGGSGTIQMPEGPCDSGVVAVVGTWYRVWYVYNSQQTPFSSIYVNGVLKATSTGQPAQVVNANDFIMGQYHDGFGAFIPSNVKMVDARYYTVAVTPETIWQDFEPSTRYDLWLSQRSRRWFAPAITSSSFIPPRRSFRFSPRRRFI